MAVNFEHFFLESEHDGLKLGVEMCTPKKKKVIGVIQLIHGMCEHKERYFHMCEYFAEKGYASIIHDHRGHGESIKSPDDLGYFYEDGFNGMIDDAHQITVFMKEKYPDVPYFLFGHSMGSLIVRGYIKRYDYELDGLIICGCVANPVVTPAVKQGIKYMIKAKGDHHRPEKITGLGIDFFNLRFDNVTGSNEWICANPETREQQAQDPLCNFTFTLNGYDTLMRLVSDVYSHRGWKLKNPELPIFFVSGRDDPCMVTRGRFIDALGSLQNVGYENISYRLYPGMRHELMNEKDCNRVFDDMLEKMDVWTYIKKKKESE